MLWASSLSHTTFGMKYLKLSYLLSNVFTFICIQGRQENFWTLGQKETCPPPPILQIMILKLSPPRCVISKESVQQKWIDEQLSTCLFVWTLNYNSWAPGRLPGWPPSQWDCMHHISTYKHISLILVHDFRTGFNEFSYFVTRKKNPNIF